MKSNKTLLREKRRAEYPLQIAQWWHEHMRERVRASGELFGRKFFRGDCHSHTIFSDGIGTVAEMDAMKNAAGLDFLFITDHWTVAQKRECVKFKNLWWGQEPVTQYHHLGILDNPRTYKVKKDLLQDVAAAGRLGKGRYFVSEAPLIDLDVRSGNKRGGMGQRLSVSGGKATLSYRVADSFGLQVLRVVQNGKVIREIELGRQPFAEGSLPIKVARSSRYVRIECNAKDWRRGYSNPVYFVNS